MRISLIIAVYKDIEALKLIIHALKKQNYKNLEVVIAEDNNCKDMAAYVNSITDLDIVHTTQEDRGIRKARSQNNAIIQCSGDYLIFIDGDCLPYSSFITAHATLAKRGHVLSGRRVNLGPGISEKIRKNIFDPLSIEKHFFLKSWSLLRDGSTHTTQGIYISPKSWLYKNTIKKRKKSNLNILGCNFSCFKEDILAIDGFDESYGETAVPDDTDLQWRLVASGLKLKTCKMAANQLHLHHTRHHQVTNVSHMVEKMHRRKSIGNYIAEIGLSSHDSSLEKPVPDRDICTDKTYDFDVSIILINYNSSAFTINCINSIRATISKDISYGIVIVDNASEPEDYKNLSESLLSDEKNNTVKLVRSKINVGFSAGNMIGVQNIDSKYYFLLNNDCILQNDCVGILYDFCEKNSQVALCSAQLVTSDGKPQPCINYFPTLKTKIFGSGVLSFSHSGKHTSRKAIYEKPVQVDVVSGSQMFLRGKDFFNVGGLDTTFFLYCEEEDLALRLYNAGYKTYLVPEARNYHVGNASTKKSLAIKKEFYISFLYFYRKHYGFTNTSLIKLILCLRLLRKALKDKDSLKLALFVASGAHLKNSLRHMQKIIK